MVISAAVALGLIGFPLFVLFILEEAVQAASFGLFVLSGAKMWEQVGVHLEKYKKVIDALDKTVTGMEKTLLTSERIRPLLKAIYPDASDTDVSFLDGVITFLINPYRQYVIASRANAAAYEARVAEWLEGINPEYYDAKKALERQIDLGEFSLSQGQDELLDELRTEKAQRKDELQIQKKTEKAEVTAAASGGFSKEYIDAVQLARREADKILDEERYRLDKELDALRLKRTQDKRAARAESENLGEPQEQLNARLDAITAQYDEDDRALRIASEARKDEIKKVLEEGLQTLKEEESTRPGQTRMTAKEARLAKIAIDEKYNEYDIQLRREFDERDRVIRATFFDSKWTLKRVATQKRIALRAEHFPPESAITPGVPTPEEFTGAVFRVIDGDTIDIGTQRVRLLGIDAAELGTEKGDAAKALLTLKLSGQTVTVRSDKTRQFDVYGRLRAVIILNGRNINLEMLREGAADLDLREPNKWVDPAEYQAAWEEGHPPPEGPPPEEPQPPPTPTKPELPDRYIHAGYYYDYNGTSQQGFPPDLPPEYYTPIGKYQDYYDMYMVHEQPWILFIWQPDEYNWRKATYIRAEEAPTEPVELPEDNNRIFGAAALATFGLLDPPRPLGDAGNAATNVITAKREFTAAEVSDTSQEILSGVIRFSDQIKNPEPLCVEFDLLRPDGITKHIPGASCIATPQSHGYGWWNWTAHGCVLNGIGGDLSGKGLYKLTFKVTSGQVITGTYNLYFKVV